jgi:arginine/lysine/ornithine decarboxylase
MYNTVPQNLHAGVEAGALPPLAAGLASHAGEGYLGFHTPGHHQGRAAWAPWRDLLGEAAFFLDLTELPGLDNLQDPQGIIREAASEASAFFGAAETHFLVNGASAGILAVLLALCQEGDRVLVPRNCHQSVVHGLVLSGATPVYLPVHFHPGLGLPGLLRTEGLRACLGAPVASHGDQAAPSLTEHPAISPLPSMECPPTGSLNGEAADTSSPSAADFQEGGRRLLVLLHPNYYGLAGNLAEQIEMAHQCGLLVLTDEAHGSHFCASPLFPASALTVGADFTVMGAHKTLGAFTQAAWLHCRESGAAASRVNQALRLVQTTSPSYLLMASLDVARYQLQQSGERWGQTAGLGLRLRREISRIPGLMAPGEELLDVPGVTAYDPARLVVNVSGLGITGFTAGGWLARERRLLVEMSDLDNLVFILGPGDEGPAADALLDGLRDLAAACGYASGEFENGTSSGGGERGEHCGSVGTCSSTGENGLDGCTGAGGGYHARDVGVCGRGAPELSAIMPDLYNLPIPCQILTPRQAFFAPHCQVPLEAAVGKIAAETITPYPPGVPLICPGEVIDKPVLECLKAWRQAGGTWPGQARGAVYVVDRS